MKPITVKELYSRMDTRQVDKLLAQPDGIYVLEKEFQSFMKVKKAGVTEIRESVVSGEFQASTYIAVYEAKGTVTKTRKAIVTKEGTYYYTMEYHKNFEAVATSLI